MLLHIWVCQILRHRHYKVRNSVKISPYIFNFIYLSKWPNQLSNKILQVCPSKPILREDHSLDGYISFVRAIKCINAYNGCTVYKNNSNYCQNVYVRVRNYDKSCKNIKLRLNHQNSKYIKASKCDMIKTGYKLFHFPRDDWRSVLRNYGTLCDKSGIRSTKSWKISRFSPFCHFPVMYHQIQRMHIRTISPVDASMVSSTDIKKYLTDLDIKCEQGYTCFSLYCPRLTKRKMKMDSGHQIYVNLTTGYFVCNECGKSGQWSLLQDNLTMLTSKTSNRKRKDAVCFPELDGQSPPLSFTSQLSQLWASRLDVQKLSEDAFNDLVHKHKITKISLNTLRRYAVTTDNAYNTLLFPIFSGTGQFLAVKKFTPVYADDGSTKGIQETCIPKGDIHGLFGLHDIPATTTDLVITANELDALAVYESTKMAAVSLPRGYSSMPQQVLPYLERFSKIILWFGNDMISWESAKIFAKKLNDKRCHIIRPSDSSPNALSALTRDLNLAQILASARSLSHQSISSFSQLRLDVFHELSHLEQVAGIKWRRYPTLNKLLKGHRRGELTVFTGPTGSGKTTFMSDYSLDLCMQGVNTLWGSFEISNVRLMKIMLTQFAQMNLSRKLQSFDFWADSFEQLPMYFMRFHGQENTKKVIETMSHAVYIHDIAHVIVDNLQFMMGVDERSMYSDKYQRQDHIIAAFRKFATTMNCHVTLIIHPRKERDGEDLTPASIYGSAKATQESDNVLILQDKRLAGVGGRKYIQVAKNRFDGELGVMLLKFDKESLSFASKPKQKPDVPSDMADS